MWPTIGGLKTYIFIYGLAMISHLGASLWYCRRMRIRLRVGVALNVCFVFGMCVGARILYDVLHSRLDWHNYLDIGYYFTDGLWGGPLAYLMLAVTGAVILARDRLRMLDLIALTLPLPMIIAKVSCFVNGCCYGAATNVPWAVTFPEGAEAPASIARHATQLYEVAVLAVIALLFLRLDRARWSGTLLAWFVMLYGLGRPLTEMFRDAAEREATVGPLSSSQAVCLAASIVAAVVLLVARHRRSKAVCSTAGSDRCEPTDSVE